ncbi:hypothetical protein ACLB2K_057215 [Fragaria x ananassa]
MFTGPAGSFAADYKVCRSINTYTTTMSLEDLPQDCFQLILSLTSPRDASRSSLVSLSIRAMADSDSVWEKFLPEDYAEILSRLVTPIPYSSNKDLFIKLCDPNLIDGGKKMFSIEKSTGKKCYILIKCKGSFNYMGVQSSLLVLEALAACLRIKICRGC